MKNFSTLLLLTLLSSAFCSAQVYRYPKDSADDNPFMRTQEVFGNRELILLQDEADGNHYVHNRVYDFLPGVSANQSLIAKNNFTQQQDNDGSRLMDIAVGDFNKDKRQDLVIVRPTTDQQILISIPNIDHSTFDISDNITLLNPGPVRNATYGDYNGRVKVVTGDFDGDGQSEFAIAYMNINDQKIHIDVYDVDSATLTPTLATSIADETLSVNSTTGYYESFDLVAKDLDMDGNDELVLVATSEQSGKWKPFAKIYDVTGSGAALTISPKAKTTFDSSFNSNWALNLKVVAGDFNGDLTNEIVVVYGSHIDDGYGATTDMKILVPADDATTDPNHPDYLEALVDSSYGFTTFDFSGDNNNKVMMSVASGDVDNDGLPEVVVSSMNAFKVFKEDTSGNFVQLGDDVYLYTAGDGGEHDAFMAIGDVNRNGKSEIVNVRNYDDYYSSQYLELETHEYDPNAPGKFKQTGFSSNLEQDSYSGSSSIRQYAIATGDFDGDNVSFGKGRHYSVTNIVQPLVVLNAPPIHFDSIPGAGKFDVNNCFSGSNCNFKSEYKIKTAYGVSLSTKTNSDWSVSADVNAGVSLGMVDIGASLSASYGQKFSKTNSSKTNVTTITDITTFTDDRIFAIVNNYSVWEYPVYAGDTLMGYVTSLVPELSLNTWMSSNDETANEWYPLHDATNILSYRNFSYAAASNPDLASIIKDNNSLAMSVNNTSQTSWSTTWQDVIDDAAEQTTEIGVDASVTAGALGNTVKLSGSYNWSGTSTHSSTIDQAITDSVSLGALPSNSAASAYQVVPYTYWSNNGSLTLDYLVAPSVPALGDPNTFWSLYYEKQDPALLLPWRLNEEKGLQLIDPAKKTQSKSIRFSEEDPQPGDTFTIYTRVFNFSLVPTSSSVQVQMFLGDPNQGGALLTSTTGQTIVSTPDVIPPQDFADVPFTWVAPYGVINDPRIYAVIDPGNLLDEVHEDNNLGWRALGTYYPLTVGISDLNNPGNQKTLSIFPNPATDIATVNFHLDESAAVSIELIDLTGRNVFTSSPEFLSAGDHQTAIDLNSVKAGIYFCRLISGKEEEVAKLVVTH